MDTVKNVLDKGYVRLIDFMGKDLSVVRAARVSHNADWRTGDNEKNDEKLIRYLWTHRHTTPFEAVTFSFEVKAPIFIFRQWHRHRTQSYNEISARYTELEDEFYIPLAENIGSQSTVNKQVRITSPADEDLLSLRESQVDAYVNQCSSCFDEYKNLLQSGWPRELARMVLPLSTYSRMFMTCNLLNLFKFITLRSDPDAQWEIQQYSNALLELITPIVPVCVEAYKQSIDNVP